MSVPKSVVKFDKNGVRFESSVDKTKYLIKELIRAALRDTGKFICREFRQSYYSHFRRKKRLVGAYTQFWVRTRQETPDLMVGLKNDKGKTTSAAFYGGFQELGTEHRPRLGLLRAAVMNNIPTIIKIQSQYLSALESEAAALAKINENDYEGGAEDE